MAALYEYGTAYVIAIIVVATLFAVSTANRLSYRRFKDSAIPGAERGGYAFFVTLWALAVYGSLFLVFALRGGDDMRLLLFFPFLFLLLFALAASLLWFLSELGSAGKTKEFVDWLPRFVSMGLFMVIAGIIVTFCLYLVVGVGWFFLPENALVPLVSWTEAGVGGGTMAQAAQFMIGLLLLVLLGLLAAIPRKWMALALLLGAAELLLLFSPARNTVIVSLFLLGGLLSLIPGLTYKRLVHALLILFGLFLVVYIPLIIIGMGEQQSYRAQGYIDVDLACEGCVTNDALQCFIACEPNRVPELINRDAFTKQVSGTSLTVKKCDGGAACFTCRCDVGPNGITGLSDLPKAGFHQGASTSYSELIEKNATTKAECESACTARNKEKPRRTEGKPFFGVIDGTPYCLCRIYQYQ